MNSLAGESALDYTTRAKAARDAEVINLVRDIIPELNMLVDRIERFADKAIQEKQEE